MNFPQNFPKPHIKYFDAALMVLKNLAINQNENAYSIKQHIKNVSKEYKINTIPLWVVNWVYYNQSKIQLSSAVLNKLIIKKVRSNSGIIPVSVFTKPFACTGRCIFCPDQKDLPKSYLSNEPAVMRAIRNNYNPQKQIYSRLRQLKFSGHNLDKIELIVLGGTFSNLPNDYRKKFIADCYSAINSFPNKFKREILTKAIETNETAVLKVVGLTIETRPDWINEKEIKLLREIGVTRVELGVQSINDDILALLKRDHGSKETVNATRLLKNTGFKICYHIMPGLPGSSSEIDVDVIVKLFHEENYQPDLLKIYPLVVTKYSQLEEWYKEGKYVPLSDEDLVALLVKIKKYIPRYVRIQRLGRDIPATDIVAGSTKSNIRQMVAQELTTPCKCIRCREIGDKKVEELDFVITEYKSSGQTEYFMEYINPKNDDLYALLRLRTAAESNIFSVLRGAAIIREVHTYGKLTEIGKSGDVQHKGLGKKLLVEAEKKARSLGFKKIAIISGIGVRGYYKKLGYTENDSYMIKDLF